MQRSEEHRANTPSEEVELEDGFYSLEFAARKSIRYLTKRKRFFDNWHYLNVAVTALSGSGAFASLMSGGTETIAKVLTGITAIASSLDLAVGFSKRGKQYDNLQKRFSDLLIKIIQSEKTKESLVQLEAERLQIEKDEPPTLIALDIFCHNEECRAQNKLDSLYQFGWFRRCLMHWWSFEGWSP